MFNFFMASNKKIRSKSKSMEDIFFDRHAVGPISCGEIWGYDAHLY